MIDFQAEWEALFYAVKAAKRIVRVTDRYGQVYEGRIYRNGFDRLNIVSTNSSLRGEIYYSNIQGVEILDRQPKNLPDFFGDWNRRTRNLTPLSNGD